MHQRPILQFFRGLDYYFKINSVTPVTSRFIHYITVFFLYCRGQTPKENSIAPACYAEKQIITKNVKVTPRLEKLHGKHLRTEKAELYPNTERDSERTRVAEIQDSVESI